MLYTEGTWPLRKLPKYHAYCVIGLYANVFTDKKTFTRLFHLQEEASGEKLIGMKKK